VQQKCLGSGSSLLLSEGSRIMNEMKMFALQDVNVPPASHVGWHGWQQCRSELRSDCAAPRNDKKKVWQKHDMDGLIGNGVKIAVRRKAYWRQGASGISIVFLSFLYLLQLHTDFLQN